MFKYDIILKNQQQPDLWSGFFGCYAIFLGSFFSVGSPICFFNTVLANV